MAEELYEQIAYGDYCRHGVALGTPGGADLICGYCEAGLDIWVDDPKWELWAIFVDGDAQWPIRIKCSWRESDAHTSEIRKKVAVAILRTLRAFSSTAWIRIEFEARKGDLGFWTSEDEKW